MPGFQRAVRFTKIGGGGDITYLQQLLKIYNNFLCYRYIHIMVLCKSITSEYIKYLFQEQSRCISPVVVFRYSGESSESDSSEGSNSSDEGAFSGVCGSLRRTVVWN